MVAGMSVRNSEPGAGTKKLPQGKAKPSVEAVQMAQILEDSRYPPDLSDKIKAVAAVVPDKSEEEICIALHDADYSPEAAISVLLDFGEAQGQWTTREGRKGKKKLNDSVDLIVAPGDKLTRGRRSNTGTNRAAGTRENHGGGVSVKTGGRTKQNKPKRKPPANAPPTTGRRIHKKSQPPVIAPPLEVWDSVPMNGGDWESGELQWQEPGASDTWVGPDAQEPGGDFPEAIPQPPAPLVSQSESTAGETTTHQPTVQQQAALVIEPKTRKSRRIAKSVIPTIPVEMPQEEGDSLDLQFGSLGIDFGEQSPPHDFHSPTDMHRLAEDPGVIAVSTGGFSEAGRGSPVPILEGPPGLTHPAVHDSPSERPPSSTKQELNTSVYSTSAQSSELLMSNSGPQVATAAAGTVTTSASSGKQVAPGVIYPHMMHQYPAFMTMYPGPTNYADPNEMSRYQASVSLAYYQQSDPALSAAGTHYTTGGDKFGRADVSPSVSQASGHTPAGTQGGAGMPFVNYTYPGNMFYPMYFPQPHSITPKPTSGSSYPVGGVSSYQTGANYSYPEETSSHDYKMYSGGGVKTSSKTSSSENMGLGSYKGPHYDGGKATTNYQAQSFGIQNQTQYMGYMQAMPTGMPLPAPMQHTALLPDGSTQRASNVGGGKSKNPYPNYWSGNP